MIFVIDLAGTLLDSKNNLPKYNLKAIKNIHAKKHTLIISTRHSHFRVNRMANKLGISSYIVLNNGASIYDVKNNNYHNFEHIPKPIINKVQTLIQGDDIILSLHTAQHEYNTIFGMKNEWDIPLTYHVLSKHEFQKIKTTKKIYQISLKCLGNNSIDLENHLRENLSDEFIITQNNNNTIDINIKSQMKYNAVKWVIQKLKLNNEKIIAFGDANSDITMVEGADIGIAMANSSNGLIDAANKVISNNDTDALANEIKQLLKR